MNAVQTRASARRLQREAETAKRDTERINQAERNLRCEIEAHIFIPTLEAKAPELDLLKVDKRGF